MFCDQRRYLVLFLWTVRTISSFVPVQFVISQCRKPKIVCNTSISTTSIKSMKYMTTSSSATTINTNDDSSNTNHDVDVVGVKQIWEGPLFGRLTKSGKEFLLRHGWEKRTDVDTFSETAVSSRRSNQQQKASSSSSSSSRLAFIWPSKSGPQFSIDDDAAAHIRPYPKFMTDVVDDKVHLAAMFNTTEDTKTTTTTTTKKVKANIVPKTIHIITEKDIDMNKLYFVKHRYGAQGKSVYVYDGKELIFWYKSKQEQQELTKKHKKNTTNNNILRDFVIQEEIIPALYDNRKFVLRVHLLIVQRNKNNNDGNDSSNKSKNGNVTRNKKSIMEIEVEAYLHENVICQHHASIYDRTDRKKKSSHISQAGKNHPMPVLLRDLQDNDHPAKHIHPQQMEECCKIIVQEMTNRWKRLLPTSNENDDDNDDESHVSSSSPHLVVANQTTCFALLGLDVMVDHENELKLCEVNSHPALGWGTMSKVPKIVFDELIEDTLSILTDKENLKLVPKFRCIDVKYDNSK